MSDLHLNVDQQAAVSRSDLVGRLIAAGYLADPLWQAVFNAVPRHLFVPQFYQNSSQGSVALDATHGPAWLSAVYADVHLVTRDDVRSSSTAPSLMATMLQALELSGDETVLEIGTGTGYNAGLLSERVGDEQVVSVDIDPDLVEQARQQLALAGYHPLVAFADGAEGFPEAGPYARIIATCRVDSVPMPWLRQLEPGGIVVAPIGAGLAQIRKALTSDDAEGRFLPDAAYFMPLRHEPGQVDVAELIQIATGSTGVTRVPDFDAEIYRDNEARFWLDLTNPDVRVMHEEGRTVVYRTDGSWARLSDGLVVQGGPAAVWDEVEAAHRGWRAVGRPSRERYRLKITSDGQQIFLDGRPAAVHELSRH